MKDCATKYRIMEMALDLIWHSSYDAVGVDAICRKAKINKGSFYHFFKSKEALAVAALEEHWQRVQPSLDQIFSSQKPGLQRIRDYCDQSYKTQKEKQTVFGFVCGCPYTTVGVEQCCQSRLIREMAEKLLDRKKKYFVSAIKDALEEGTLPGIDAREKADQLFTYCLGAITQARIYNDLKILANLKDELMVFLGVKEYRSAHRG